MHAFVDKQRVLVRKTDGGVTFAPPEPGSVSRIRIRDDSAFIDLDVGKRVSAFPEDCDPMEVKDAVAIAAVAPDRFGRDHRSTLLYIESRCVDFRGSVEQKHMRTNNARHPGRGPGLSWKPQHGSRLADGSVLPEHDDWDCIDDMIRCGWMENHGSAINPSYCLTDAGWAEAHRVRRERAEGVRSISQ